MLAFEQPEAERRSTADPLPSWTHAHRRERAGLGGLVLAQALRDHADVIVLDRDANSADTGGYRIVFTPEAVAVIERHVPAPLVDRIRSVSDGAETFSQFTIADSHLRPIVVAPEPPGQDRMLCQRRALRQIPSEGLGERVRFSSTVVSAQTHGGGATVTLADGSRVDADLVVAADGARSATLQSFAPDTSSDTGLVGIAASTPLTRRTGFPRYLLHGPALAIDRHVRRTRCHGLAARRPVDTVDGGCHP